MKKKVLIMTFSLQHGGVETSLVNMLKNVDYSKYEIDILITDNINDYMDEIPKEVNIILNEYKLLKQQITDSLKTLKLIKVFKLLKILLCGSDIAKKDILIQSMNFKSKAYDYAIAYHSNFQVQYIYSQVKAKKKIMYIHCDPVANLKEPEKYLKMYENYDLICCVSNKVKEELIKMDFNLKENTVVMYNILDVKKIQYLSKVGKSFDDKFEGIRLLTIGRVSKEKGYQLVVEALKNLIEKDYPVKWYVIGDGDYMQQLRNLININKLSEYFICLGSKENPYTYLKDCDIYVQPSLYETYCIATEEAKIFNLPIVRTNTPGAEEQFDNMRNGIITEISAEGLYQGIVKYLEDKNLKNNVIQALKNEDKMNNCIDQIAKIEELLKEKG